eukprot:6030741-Pyramimonas_sp.AAC.1
MFHREQGRRLDVEEAFGVFREGGIGSREPYASVWTNLPRDAPASLREREALLQVNLQYTSVSHLTRR